ncbi:MFS transporter [Solwaraspora sp. WMMD1047]|uniref:MFS transporter n=1 Tax=Solwaraspora sp. WMMD1047 TaxID=3016102 RepID=UPI0024170D91|nr:MFS transporter [Solwaraspora sp. WMMD1047]MDG4828053.1 MFS transporter [Solwaraspora sp. WMMD1047]
MATVSWPAFRGGPAVAAPPVTAPPVSAQPAGLCSTEEWRANFRACVDRLEDVGSAELQCLEAPTPASPESGLPGWFGSRPDPSTGSGVSGLYSQYGYAGYSFETYDDDGGCASGVLDPGTRAINKIASVEMTIATGVIGASNAVRERAWDPQSMWSWADPLVEQATEAVYEKVFGVFGIITLCVVGLYLLWRSRQSDMSSAMTTAGWAVLVMVAVTAIAAWPVKSANIADGTLMTSLTVIHEAVGPRPKEIPPDQCDDPGSCGDNRLPAVRASDTSTETMLYRNWLRGVLGSSESETAQRYGRALYDAKALTWEEAERLRSNPADREATIKAKQNQWMKVARQIKSEDPEAYDHLRGARDMDRLGSGFIALLASVLFAMFDLTAALLVLLGFLIFRWAVIAAPILGTIGLLRPASAGLRRLGNAVVAAVFNIAIFGTGAAIYLFAVDLIMSTATLPGWLQVVLVWLTGVVGWLLLRPYRRITQLGGKDGSEALGSAGSWHRRFFLDLRTSARLGPAEPGGTAEPKMGRRAPATAEQSRLRPEARLEDPSHSVASRPDGREAPEPGDTAAPGGGPQRNTGGTARPARRRAAEWTEPDVPEEAPSYVVYRPDSARRLPSQSTPTQSSAPPRVRSEAR